MKLQKVTDEIQYLITTLTCLKIYKPDVSDKGHKTCDPTGVLGPDDLTTANGSALSPAFDSGKSASGKDLPTSELKYSALNTTSETAIVAPGKDYKGHHGRTGILDGLKSELGGPCPN